MSVSVYFFSALVLFVACYSSWKAALYWNFRTRDACAEDPRDQEIRELGAALSIARKEAAKCSDEAAARRAEAAELASKLEHTSSALADTQQKFNAIKESHNKDLEEKHDLQEELTQLQRDLERSNTQIEELKLLSKSAGDNDLLSESDMLPHS